VFGKIVDDMTAVLGPLICDQFPTPGEGVFAAIVATVPQTEGWSAPAFATVAELLLLIIISSLVMQLPFVIVHL
jgi:hypothetical protein